ncbi:MAG: PocR ligand-binding domain-containing protein [Clostridia bacterium]|nr:PocR ligand-binding domain-containing protein [Clostridia bacterium]
MMIELELAQIQEVMKSFYITSGIRFVLFDAAFKEILSYPERDCDFCKIMKACPNTRRKCRLADRRSFENCEKTGRLFIYKCHAGLVEAVIPLYENKKIIGYLMFGQITDDSDKEKLYDNITFWSQRYGMEKTALRGAIKNITYKTEEQIYAAAKIMEICTSYIIYKELISPESDRAIKLAKGYIEEHLSEELDIKTLCENLGMGRTTLYELFKKETGMGIAAYIRKRRLHKAKKLLKTTDLTISEIALSTGFSDYNYFSRIYKKVYGKSPKNYR